ncbi:NAD(P)-dependent oxidoreductase [Streptosporangiaceae bacterium NEAU-GS5]|nr:NAD(P)-dependent oxidoreductase [Streptosporangiaceae bacterium NEAU-GS5]
MRVAILGLGEAGRRYAADLAAAGRQVVGYDPAPVPTPPGVTRALSISAAVTGADLVVSLTGGRHAVSAAAEAAAALSPTACYADFNTTAPALKLAVAATIAADVADVAVLAPVLRHGAATPLLASGPGAHAITTAFRPLGTTVDVLADEPVGAAAGRKLLRSVFMKGLAAAVIEAVTAATAAGCPQWVRDQIAAELGPDGPALVERLITGTGEHAARRLHEMRAGKDYLDDLGTPTHVSEATIAWLTALSQHP